MISLISVHAVRAFTDLVGEDLLAGILTFPYRYLNTSMEILQKCLVEIWVEIKSFLLED